MVGSHRTRVLVPRVNNDIWSSLAPWQHGPPVTNLELNRLLTWPSEGSASNCTHPSLSLKYNLSKLKIKFSNVNKLILNFVDF